jgi:hypothetical protein
MQNHKEITYSYAFVFQVCSDICTNLYFKIIVDVDVIFIQRFLVNITDDLENRLFLSHW